MFSSFWDAASNAPVKQSQIVQSAVDSSRAVLTPALFLPVSHCVCCKIVFSFKFQKLRTITVPR